MTEPGQADYLARAREGGLRRTLTKLHFLRRPQHFCCLAFPARSFIFPPV